MKPALIVYGNCQAEWVARSLGIVPEIVDRFEVTFVRGFDHPVHGPSHVDPSLLRRAAVLLEQRGAWDRFPWSGDLPAGVQSVTFPALAFDAQWPMTTFSDPRNVPEPPDYPFGRFPYGDRLISGWLAEGMSPEQAFERYLTFPVRDTEDLARAEELSIVRLELAEVHCDVRMTDVVLSRFRDEPLFYTCNHARPVLFSILVERIIEAGLLASDVSSAAQLTGEFFEAQRPLANIQVPIHPDVAQALDLKWYHSGLQYCCFDLTGVDYAGYWRAYTWHGANA